MRKLILILSLIVGFILLYCCSAVTIQSTQTPQPLQKGTVLSTRTAVVPVETLPYTQISPALTSTQTPVQTIPILTHYSEIPPGLYIVYADEDNHIYVTTQDKKFQALLTDKVNICFNTSDGQQIYICNGDKKYRLDVQQDRLDTISFDGEPSPDHRWVAHNCKGYEDWESLAVQQVGQNDEYCLLQPTDKSLLLDFLGWSPDGKWLAYTKEMGKMFIHDLPAPEDGLYLISTSCLNMPETCKKHTEGPFFITDISFRSATPWYSHWSPDGQQLALYAVDTSELLFFQIASKKFRKLTLTSGRGWVDRIALSPDGSTIAYTRPIYPDNCCTFLEPLSGGSSFQMAASGETLSPLFWLTIPSFHKEQRLKISNKGSHLNLRDQPSMSGKVITQLLEGDEVKILDGPVGFGTYVWWKLHLEKKNLDGWAIEVKEWYDPIAP